MSRVHPTAITVVAAAPAGVRWVHQRRCFRQRTDRNGVGQFGLDGVGQRADSVQHRAGAAHHGSETNHDHGRRRHVVAARRDVDTS